MAEALVREGEERGFMHQPINWMDMVDNQVMRQVYGQSRAPFWVREFEPRVHPGGRN